MRGIGGMKMRGKRRDNDDEGKRRDQDDGKRSDEAEVRGGMNLRRKRRDDDEGDRKG